MNSSTLSVSLASINPFHRDGKFFAVLKSLNLPQRIYSTLSSSEIRRHFTLNPIRLEPVQGQKHPLICQYLNSLQGINWDHATQSMVYIGLIQKVSAVFYNLFYYLTQGHVRYEDRQEFFLLKILEHINSDSFFKDKEFLKLSLSLRQKLAYDFNRNPHVQFKILARQIIQKIDLIHRQFLHLSNDEKKRIYSGLPPFIALNRDLALEHVSSDGLNLRFLPLFQNDPEIVKAAYIENPLSIHHCSESLKTDENFIKSLIVHSEYVYLESSLAIKSLQSVILEVLKKNGELIVQIPEGFQEQKPFVVTALKHGLKDAKFLTPFTCDKEVMLLAYSKNFPLKLIDPALNDDEEFVKAAISLKGWDVYMRASPRVKAIASVKVAAYKKRFMKKQIHPDQIELLKRVSPEIFDDEEFVMHFTKLNGQFYRHISPRLKAHEPIILEALKTFPFVIHSIDPVFLSSKTFTQKACALCPDTFAHIDEELKKDYDVYTVALEQNAFNYYHLPSCLQKNSNIIKMLLLNDPAAIDIVSVQYLNHDDGLEVLKKKGYLFNRLPFKKSPSHLHAAIKSYPHIIHSISQETLLEFPELLRVYVVLKLEKSLVTLNQKRYLPLPLDDKYLILSEETEENFSSIPWENLIDGEGSEMYQFINSLNQSTLSKANFSHFPGPNLEARKQAMKDSLHLLSQRLRHKTPFLGTPKSTEPEQLNEFYETVYYYLGRIANIITQDKSLISERLQILEASSVCGGGLIGQLSELDRQLIVPKASKIDQVIAFKLSHMATKKLGLMNRGGSVHKANRLKWHFHPFIGGKKITFDHLSSDENEIDLTFIFFKYFNPKAICEELVKDMSSDEDFYGRISDYINSTLLKKFATEATVREVVIALRQEFKKLLETLDEMQNFLQELTTLLEPLNAEDSLKALITAQRPGSDRVILRTLQVGFKSVPMAALEELYSKKGYFKAVSRYFTRLSSLTCSSISEILSASKTELQRLFDNHQDELAILNAERVFDEVYRNESGLLKPEAMAYILKDMGFLEEISFDSVTL